MVYELDKNVISFPDPHYGEDDGLIAVGGDLSIDRLLLAYSNGIFPWYSFKNEPIMWWCPMKRFVIFPEEIHISHSMKQLMKSDRYRITVNEAFKDVMINCGKADGRNEMEGAWLGDKMIEAYTELHRQGFAASVEVWDDDHLVGGLYGVNIGNSFFGESMFSLQPNTSKLALITLAMLMGDSGGIIDCQFETSHLKSMGGRYISYEEYMDIIKGQDDF